jgi:hypothetical protein
MPALNAPVGPSISVGTSGFCFTAYGGPGGRVALLLRSFALNICIALSKEMPEKLTAYRLLLTE